MTWPFAASAGRRAQVEDYLKKYPELLAGAVPVELMWLEHQLHEKHGIPISNPSMAIHKSQGGDGRGGEGGRHRAARQAARAAADSLRAAGGVRATMHPPKLGSGNSGAVYQAQDTHLHRRVALKVPRFREEDGPDALLRFWRDGKRSPSCSIRTSVRYLTSACSRGFRS